ncbi:hypothetical protein Acr_15g0004960 [Actinidia rufa]|uniref:Uncharacterized protein n=1 Tax=Actinidia rufa TaxID=165716 RepID=A0A7J0FTY6_9ERIC|nr:hypothetical protein Acr_15g0004960 [Actinidia rufa]
MARATAPLSPESLIFSSMFTRGGFCPHFRRTHPSIDERQRETLLRTDRPTRARISGETFWSYPARSPNERQASGSFRISPAHGKQAESEQLQLF